jgi:hypothetical protein
VVSCEDANSLLDPERSLIDTYGEIRDDTLYAIADTFIVTGTVQTGFSPKLLVGGYREYSTRSLLKFSGFPSDTFRLDSVRILLSSISTFDDPMIPVQAVVYNLIESWENDVNTDESWQNPLDKVDPVPLANVSFDATMTDSVNFEFNISPDIVRQWQDTTGGEQNHGLLIDYSVADHIIEFASRENQSIQSRPRIVYIYTDLNQDSTIRDTVLTLQDASLISFSGSFDEQQLFVSAGYTTQAFFKFDFSVLPKNIGITSVNFAFTKDTIASLTNSNRAQTVLLRNAVTDYNNLPVFELDSSFTTIIFRNVILADEFNVLTLDKNIRAGIGQVFIQSIINELMVHGSFFLQYSSEGNDISVYAIRGINDPDVSARPQLRIQYYFIPEGRL